MTGIFERIRRSDPDQKTAKALCDSVIGAARAPDLYLQGLVDDTFDGRFAATALHGGLLMRRLRSAGPQGLRVSEKLGEALFDRFDYALREEGVGDATIARKARALGEAFFGLARAIDDALSQDVSSRTDLIAVLKRNGLGGSAPEHLADRVLSSVETLERCKNDDLLCGTVNWRD